MAKAKAALKKAVTATAAAVSDPTAAKVLVNVFDGTRQLVQPGAKVLLTVHDGAQNQKFRDFVSGPSIAVTVPFHNNFMDAYSIVAFIDGYEQAGFQPVNVDPHVAQQVDLMLLKKNSAFHFADAKWSDVQAQKPSLSRIWSASGSGGNAGDAYEQMMEDNPDRLACLLNITTAMEQIFLPAGTPLDYFKEFDLLNLKADRIFGYADAALVDQVALAAQQGEFSIQPAADLALHGDATKSFKQIQFGEANVQLTFHEKHRKTIGGVDCVYVEPDIDYFKDPLAHLFLEVIPNAVSGNLSDPRVVYVLRWIAGRHAGVPSFDPLYTIE